MKYRLDINNSTNEVSIVGIDRELRLSEIKDVPYFECGFENGFIKPYYQRYYLSDLGKGYAYKMFEACGLNDSDLAKAKRLVDDLSKIRLTDYLIKNLYTKQRIENLLYELANILRGRQIIITVSEIEYPDRNGKPRRRPNISNYQSSVEDVR